MRRRAIAALILAASLPHTAKRPASWRKAGRSHGVSAVMVS